MSDFTRINGALACEGVRLADIAAAEGTPVYVYSAATIRNRFRAIDDAFASHPHALHYALKANSTLAVARLLRSLGAQADANSGGEIDVALRAGFIPPEIVFTGVGKTQAELAQAIELGVRTINAESEGELERISALARARDTRARVALRVNPDIEAGTHPHISTGLKTNKFGMAIGAVRDICRRASRLEGIEIAGLHIHVGSQITDLAPLRRAAEAIVALARELRGDAVSIDHVDLGGGLGISYDGSPVPDAADYAAALLPAVKDSGLTLVLEPGRNIIAPAGALLSTVVDVKEQPGITFVVLDAGMTELIRPMLYGAFHRIEPVLAATAPEITCDIVGPLCESSDTLGKDRRLNRPAPGDLMAVMDTGAYAAVMASNYNRRTLAPEVLVDGTRWTRIRRRQTIEDILALET
ncbi:MAG: diaminopimelate decarboxylase [Acidobacteria bacterium RIFCSPLOWO2_02_FULL_67_36]|nr:MAG: diaminopimelate decarboxylase [Acidobacteria bacterium RIFCSPLOWO2_02_FULL_67_36]OFW25786.1 MAG: diaminopimelate decarboxylase [Acidobacteria bacterium RIFCSPLOWO2_12_FULL_66_21]